MKRILFYLTVLSLFVCVAACKNETPAPKSKKENKEKTTTKKPKKKKEAKPVLPTDKLDKEWVTLKGKLSLTDQQVSDLSRAEKEFNQKRRELVKKSNNKNPDATALTKLKKERRDAVNKILNKEQRKAYLEIRKTK